MGRLRRLSETAWHRLTRHALPERLVTGVLRTSGAGTASLFSVAARIPADSLIAAYRFVTLFAKVSQPRIK